MSTLSSANFKNRNILITERNHITIITYSRSAHAQIKQLANWKLLQTRQLVRIVDIGFLDCVLFLGLSAVCRQQSCNGVRNRGNEVWTMMDQQTAENTKQAYPRWLQVRQALSLSVAQDDMTYVYGSRCSRQLFKFIHTAVN